MNLGSNCTIDFYSSVSYVSGLSKGEFLGLREAIYYIDGALLRRTKNRMRSRKTMIAEDGSFPSGLLKRVTAYLDKHHLHWTYRDNRYRPRTGLIRFPQLIEEPAPYVDQHLAVEACVADPVGHGVVVMPTGVGKSRVLKDLIRRMGVKTVVVPPSAGLKIQIHSYLTACFGEDMVGWYDKKRGCTKPVTVLNIDSFPSAKPEHFYETNMMIADEFHHAGALGYRETDRTHWDRIFYKFGFTATNFRNNPDDQIFLESVLATEIFTMNPIEAMHKGYIVPILPIVQTIYNDGLKESGDYAGDYDTFIMNNLERNGKFCTFAEKMKSAKIPTLILVKRVEHGKWLQSAISGSVYVTGQGEGSDFNASQVDAFNRLEFPVLIGTSVVGEGVDTKAAGAVMLANGEKARSRVWQNIGRVVRRYEGKKIGYVFDSMDLGSKFMNKHSKARSKIYVNDFGVEPRVLD